MRPDSRADGAPRPAPSHDATGIVWASILGLLLWPLLLLLGVFATGSL